MTYKLLAVFVCGALLAACGAEPAFNEDVSTRSKASQGTGKDADAKGAPGTSENNDNNGTSNNSDDSDDVGPDGTLGGSDETTDGNTGGNTDGNDNTDGNAGSGGDTNLPDGSADDGVSPKPTPGSEILIEDGGTLDIPGEKAQRVGINFEDYTDFDYNDAVMCFEGNFKVEGTSVVSYQNQTIDAETFSASGCSHRIDVRIVHADGTSESFSYMSNTSDTIKLPFRIKSRLEVTMTTVNGVCQRDPITMHDARYAIVKPNVCNNSGS